MKKSKKKKKNKAKVEAQIAPTVELKKSSAWKWHTVAFILIVSAGIFAYSNSINGSFHFDDFHSIRDNSHIRTLNPAKIWIENNHFRFLSFYSFALNYSFDVETQS